MMARKLKLDKKNSGFCRFFNISLYETTDYADLPSHKATAGQVFTDFLCFSDKKVGYGLNKVIDGMGDGVL